MSIELWAARLERPLTERETEAMLPLLPPERQERLLEELRYREAMRRVVKTCCVWLGGAAFVLAVIAGYAEMTDACVATGAIALGLTTYGIL